MAEIPEMVKINRIVRENSDTRTFFFGEKMEITPGQFLMVWVPGLGEKPFSVSYMGEETGITVFRRGKFTERLFSMKKGDIIGVRGPYGNGFGIKDNACVVGGGCGIAPLGPLIEKLDDPLVIIGAKSSDGLIFSKRFAGAKIATDDGSSGFHGFTTDLLEKVIRNRRFGMVYACGPEIMMKRVFDMCEENGTECQVSLERYVKCGFGICGHCDIDGFMICKDGPVFCSYQLRQMKSFGSRAKLKSGKKVSVAEYAGWRCR
ncbi:MAG: dihydroorotate dehydrogenase electron transfer subunit [Candidatus Aenigmarchaeota archaeon]|nr:dihydroorotate dehydrogenase electron transfer subunit [Candidatus Aenigmarchaeota archaeon]